MNAIGPDRNFGTGSHIMYAKKGDVDSQWKTMENTLITEMPLTIHNATVVETDLDKPELALIGLVVGTDNRPIVSMVYTHGRPPANRDRAGRPVKWDGKTWKRVDFPEGWNRNGFYYIMGDTRGGVFAVTASKFAYYSRDNGETWQSIAIPYTHKAPTAVSLDYQHFRQTGNARVATFFSAEGVIEIWTVEVKPK